MFALIQPNARRWRILKDGITILSGIGSVNQAISIARLHGIVLTQFNDETTLKAA